jgi:hypothetical protein
MIFLSVLFVRTANCTRLQFPFLLLTNRSAAIVLKVTHAPPTNKLRTSLNQKAESINIIYSHRGCLKEHILCKFNYLVRRTLESYAYTHKPTHYVFHAERSPNYKIDRWKGCKI